MKNILALIRKSRLSCHVLRVSYQSVGPSVRPLVNLSVYPLVDPSVSTSGKTKFWMLLVYKRGEVEGEAVGCGWRLVTPAHPSVPIL